MPDEYPNDRRLDRRLARLEARFKTLQRVLLATAVALGGLLLLGVARPAPGTIEARRFVLVDAAARERLGQTTAFDELARQEIRKRRRLSLLRVGEVSETTTGDRRAESTGSAPGRH